MIYKKLFFLTFLITFPLKSLALIEVDITRGNLNPLPIAVSSLASNNVDKENLKKKLDVKDVGLEISSIVENNLKKSGLFNPLNKEAFLQKPDIAHLKPRFEDWALIKAQALNNMHTEIIRDMKLMGCKKISDLSRNNIRFR